MTDNIQSPFILVKRLEADVLRLLHQLDISLLSIEEQNKIARLKHDLVDARLETQDYELAETRESQLINAAKAKRYLKKVRTTISGNQLNVFGAVDVAHLAAQAEHITARLR